MFRYKTSIKVSYNQQGDIYFHSKRYKRLSAAEREEIRLSCKAACNGMNDDYSGAVLDFVTTDKGATKICMKHYISRSTLERAVRAYYEIMAEKRK